MLLEKFTPTRRYIVIALILGLSLAWMAFSRVPTNVNAATTTALAPRANFRAPAIQLNDIGGNSVSLADFKGQVVIVNFWATWCPECRAEMPALNQVYQALHARGLAILEVNQLESATQVNAYTQPFHLTMPILLDVDGNVSSRFQVRALPTTFFMDRRGVIRNVVVGGPLNVAFISSQVEPLLLETAN